MRFGFSNLVWRHLDDAARSAVIDSAEVCDFAPTVHYGGWKAVPEILPCHPYGGHRPVISALQSLFFDVAGASLVRDDAAFQCLLRHWTHVVALAARSGVPKLVFGSPGVRSRRAPIADDSLLARRVCTLADVCGERGVTLCFEVNSPRFGCEFLSNMAECRAFLHRVRHPAIGVHLDLGEIREEGLDELEQVKLAEERLCHLHLSNPTYTYRPEDLAVYASVIEYVKCRNVRADLILEVQTLEPAALPGFLEGVRNLCRMCS